LQVVVDLQEQVKAGFLEPLAYIGRGVAQLETTIFI
jgi:hypothetical protein